MRIRTHRWGFLHSQHLPMQNTRLTGNLSEVPTTLSEGISGGGIT